MKCSNCNAYINNSDKFCKNCGEKQNNEHFNQYDYSSKYSNTNNTDYNIDANHQEQFNYSYDYSFDKNKYNYGFMESTYSTNGDDKYIKAYVGPNYEKIKKQKFSLPMFLFGAAYLLYRKVWSYGLLYIIIYLLSSFLLSESTGNIITTVLNIYMCIKFNEIYMKKAEEKVDQIKQANLDKTSQELLTLCRKKGGVSLAAPIIISLITIITIIISFIGIISANILKDFSDEKHTEQIYETTIENLTYTVPEGFELTYSYRNYKNYKYVENNEYNNVSCLFRIESNNYRATYPTEEEYLKSHLPINPNKTTSEILPININNIEWKYAKISSTTYTEIQYVTIIDNIMYIIATNDSDNTGTCSKKYNELLNSTIIKKTNNSI